MPVDEAEIAVKIEPLVQKAFVRVPRLLPDGPSAHQTLKPLLAALADHGTGDVCVKCRVPILREACSPICLACGFPVAQETPQSSRVSADPSQSSVAVSNASSRGTVWTGSIAQRRFLSTLEFKPQEDKRRRSSNRNYDASIAETIASFANYNPSDPHPPASSATDPSQSYAGAATSAGLNDIPEEFFAAREASLALAGGAALAAVTAGDSSSSSSSYPSNSNKSSAGVSAADDSARSSSEGGGQDGKTGASVVITGSPKPPASSVWGMFGSPGGQGSGETAGRSSSPLGGAAAAAGTTAAAAAGAGGGGGGGGGGAAGAAVSSPGDSGSHRTPRSSTGRNFSDFFSQLSALASSSPSTSAGASASSPAHLALGGSPIAPGASAAAAGTATGGASGSSTAAAGSNTSSSGGNAVADASGNSSVRPSKEASLKALLLQLPDVGFLLSEHLAVPDRDPGGLSLLLGNAEEWLGGEEREKERKEGEGGKGRREGGGGGGKGTEELGGIEGDGQAAGKQGAGATGGGGGGEYGTGLELPVGSLTVQNGERGSAALGDATLSGAATLGGAILGDATLGDPQSALHGALPLGKASAGGEGVIVEEDEWGDFA